MSSRHDGVVAATPFGIGTPIQVTITGAAGGTASTGAAHALPAGGTPTEQAEAITRAADRASESGHAVLVQF